MLLMYMSSLPTVAQASTSHQIKRLMVAALCCLAVKIGDHFDGKRDIS
jgi:hypothetical protein